MLAIRLCSLPILATSFFQLLLPFVFRFNCRCSFASLPFREWKALIGSKYLPSDKVANRTIPMSIPMSLPVCTGFSCSYSV